MNSDSITYKLYSPERYIITFLQPSLYYLLRTVVQIKEGNKYKIT